MSEHRITTRISDAELQRRWQSLHQGMQARGLDAVLAQNSNDWLGGHVKYLTDLPATNGYPRTVILHCNGGMSVVEMGAFGVVRTLGGTDPLHRGVEEILTVPAFSAVGYTNCYEGEIAGEVLKARGHRRVGLLTPGALPHGFTEALRTRASACIFEDATPWVDELKAVKSDEEIALIRATAALQDQVFAHILAGIRPGQTDRDITASAQECALRLGSEQGIFLGGSAPVGRASVFLPRYMQGRTLAEGDHLALLIEVNGPGGFYTEIARTIVLGRASNELLDGFETVREGQAYTLGLLRPGVPARDVAAAHDAYMQARDLPAERRLYCHGQGYDMVERPLVRHDETMNIMSGMCLAVHPGYETHSMFAVICDNYMIGDEGPSACLHATDKRIFEA